MPFRAYLALIVSVALCNAALVPAADDVKNGKGAAELKTIKAEYKIPEQVRQLLQDRSYAEAVKAIDEAAAQPDAAKDYLAFLKARALHLQQKYDEAIEQYTALAKEHPKSEWGQRAKFGMAVSYARKGDFRAAELIYKEQAERLLSADRKQEIADLYLEFADAYFKPKDELQQKPDYAKALEFYKKALEVGPKPDRKAAVELQIARSYQLLGNHQEAANLYAKFIKEHKLLLPPGEGRGEGIKRDIEARFRLGEAQLALGQRDEARRTWQDLLAAHADAKHEHIPQAAFNLSATYGLPSPGNKEELSLGVSSLESFLKKYPDHQLAPQAHLRIAQSYMNFGRNADAVKAIDRFLSDKRYADKDEIADARNLLGRAYQLQKKFDQALQAWRDYLAKHASHSAWSDVQRAIIDTEYLVGVEQRQNKQYDEARKTWSEFMVKYALDSRNPAILYQLGQMYFEEEKYAEAIADWRRLVSKYPGTNESSQAQYMIAATLEGKLGKLEEALAEYKKVTWGNFTPHARVAIGRLTAKTMSIASDRVFRNNETPRIKLTSRNIDAVTVKAYKVDLETYFRKMHNVHGVEGLDISLIDPDQTIEYKVPDYADYQQLENEIEIPLPKTAEGDAPTAGVMAVTVSSKTLEATTLVIASDLEIIVKSSRDEVFVFAQNMLTGKPWPKARLLVSNGQQVFAEGQTGDDGVFKQSYKELKATEDVRIFAAADGSVASNVVSLSGLNVAQGLPDRGYIYTDRPAYRAGQLVHVRGILRKASDDNFVIEKDKKYALEVYDTRNRAVWQEDVKVSEYGTFRAMFTLPSTSPPGAYRIVVRDQEDKTHEGSFTVHEYRLEPIRLAVETERKVFYRGEEIEGKITAKFYYGAPLVGREIRYQLGSERSYTATTDANGEVKFKLPTRDFRETQVLPLAVSLPERSLSITQNFFLAAQGYTLAVSTLRNVYVAGESFDVEVKALDAEGKPISQNVTLKLLEQTNVGGKVGEREVEQHEVITDAKDGVVRKTLKVAKGATYIVRAEGTDRFENAITGQHAVQISDDEDTVRLRILADKHLYKAGDTAAVQIHWREEPALALVTYQGAKVLDYKLVELKQGANKLSVPMSARLAPNFELSVIVMTDTRAPKKDGNAAADATAVKTTGVSPKKPIVRFHTASSEFRVTRDLKVTMETKRKAGAKGPLRPGEELELVIKATDPQGKPVVAELSVAMVEQSLLAMFSSHVPAIHDFFAGGMREITVRSGSSITFSYHPATRPIDKQLLAEAERLEIAADESARLAATDAFGVAGAPRGGPLGAVIVSGADGATTNGGWGAVGGAGSVESFDTNLGLIVSQSQRVVEQEREERLLASAFSDGFDDPFAGDGNLRFNRVAGVLDETPGVNNRMLEQSALKKRLATGARAAITRGLADKRGGGQQAQTGKDIDKDAKELADFDSLTDIITSTIEPEEYGYASLGKLLAAGQNGRRANDAETSRQILEANSVNLNWSIQNGFKDFVCVSPTGEQFNVNFRNTLGDTLTAADVQKFAANLARTGAVIVAQQGPQETGYWNPVVVTDEKGEATLTLTVPEQSTAWKINAKGITADTLAGEADLEIVAKKDLFGELKLPLAFTDGDDAEIIVSVHHDLKKDAKTNIVATLRTIIGSRTIEEKKTVAVTGGGMQELTFKTSIRRPDKTANKDESKGKKDVKKDTAETHVANDLVAFELVVENGDQQDRIRRVVPIRPYGVPVYVTASGSASSDTTAWIEPNPEMPLQSPGLQIIIGPTVERSLLDIVLGTPPACQLDAVTIASGLDVTTSDLMASLALQKLLGETRDKLAPQAQALDARIRTALSQLISAQQEDGGWTWSGHGQTSHRFTSARVVWALALAKRAGYKVADDRFEKAKTYLQSQIANTSETDFESKAILLHALSVAGQGDFTLANRLHRNKPSLSTAALAHLALAFAEMDRKATAAELLEDLGERDLTNVPVRRATALGSLPWSYSATELRALFALGLEIANPDSAKTKEQVDWLMAHRTGHRWSPEKATGPAAMAVATWYAKTRFEDQHYKLTIFVNDLQAAVLDITEDSDTLSVHVPPHLLKEGKQRINFQLTGRGRYTYQAVLGGFVAADKLKNTTKNWYVRRYHEPAPLELDGQEITRGFDMLQGSYTTFRNPLTQLAVGKRGHVELNIWRANLPANTPEEQLEYLVVTEPLPSGVTVIESSITGGFERFELGAGEITFYLGNRQHVGSIHFDVHGYLPGAYKAPPTIIRNAYRPDQLAVSELKNLDVLALGAKSKDEYRLTPRELYELGKRHFAKDEFKTAGTHLVELLAKWNVNPDVYKDTARMLLDVHLNTGPAGEVVRYFEIIKEKWPDLEIPYEKIMKVAAAYHDIGEYERSYLVYRATVESSFINENGVAGFLEAQGEFLRSVEVMNRLLAEYPPEPYVAATTYALAQRVYAKAPQAAADPKLREKKINRVVLIQQALAMLDHFLTMYPEDPAADQAAFSLANALLELKAHKEVIERATRYAERYKDSDYLDSYWYIQAYGHFALGEHEKALEMAGKVAEHKRTEKQTGREVESPNKWQAIYIMGQVFHSLGKAAEAIAEYAKVDERFQDAKEAIAYFTRKEISLPEVTTMRPNEPAQVELKFRNVAAAEIRVYRIDLMKFSLLKRNLLGITEINLSGIRPFFEETFKLGDGKDYRDRSEKLKLPLKEEGAYLVVCRGDNLHASGLVLVSPLAVEVQEDAAAGRVRVTVKNVLEEDYVSDAHAKVIGSRNNEFVSGEADLRGVFVAEGIQGKSTVIAQVDDSRYAFFRGQTELGPQPAPNAPAAEPAQAPPGEGRGKSLSNETQLLEQLQGGNREIQRRQNELLDNNYKMPSNSGVKAQSAF
ncbi:MAG: MG2 domain-containing protein [Pirellulales bacterium]